MAASVDQFGKALVTAGLFTAGQVKAIWSTLPADSLPATGDAFAKLLVERSKLTEYQVQELFAGRGAKLVFGEYVVQSPIGEGGMGQVFKAIHRRMERVVAVKVIAPSAMKDAGAVRRFQREVEAAARLEHPNIVAAYDAGEAAGRHYLVMQFVDGCDLSTQVKRHGPLPVETAVDYIAQAAEGLAYAHAEGIIHRDIKPANLLVDKKGVVRILDMGLARLEGGDGLTGTEQVMGTVDYMSPEQASETKTADARSDVYSLGCTLWYLLTGKKLFEAGSMMARLLQHREAPPPSLVKERDDASWALEQVFQRMVAKKADDRYATMNDVLAALAPHRGSSAEASPTSVVSASRPHDAELSTFLKGMGPALAKSPPKSDAAGATIANARPESSTDPLGKTTSPSTGPHSHVQRSRRTQPPPIKLIAAGIGGLAIAVAAGVWTMRDREEPPMQAETVRAVAAALNPAPSASVPSPPRPARPVSTEPVWSLPVNLGHNVNSDRAERGPCMTDDGLTILFSSERAGGVGAFDLWQSTRTSLTAPWQTATNLGNAVNTVGTEEHPFVTDDGLTLLFTRNSDIWKARRTSPQGPWEKPTPLSNNVNYEGQEGGGKLSPDGLTVYFHSDRAGGLGLRDLYISRRSSQTADFDRPEFIGSFINSEHDEENPTVSRDGLTLVFGSMRPGGIGGWDLYRATRPKIDAKWSTPVNLGPRINTTASEANAQLLGDGKTLLFRSDRPGGLGGEDLWISHLVPPPAPLQLTVQKFGGHRYQFIPADVTWDEAEQRAFASAGHLVTINDEAEDAWVRKTFVEPLELGMLIWIGLRRDPASKEWTWVTGEPVTVTRWTVTEGFNPTENVTAYANSDLTGIGWGDYTSNRLPIGGSGVQRGLSRCAGFVVEWDTEESKP